MTRRYDIFFEGRIAPGADLETVKRNLAACLKSGDRVVAGLFSGRPVALKRAIDRETALKYRRILEKAGARCRIEPAAETATAGQMVCPKCGHAQPTAAECARCGIVIAKFNRSQRETAGPPPAFSTVDGACAAIRRKNMITVVLGLSLTLLIASFWLKDRLPESAQILPELFQYPLQKATDRKPFITRAGGVTYHIFPRYDYELYGMVVSFYDSTGWWDITHKFLWRDFLNIKDICVLYANNLRRNIQQQMRFKSSSYQCHFRPRGSGSAAFMATCLSNNHLLCDDKVIKRKIMGAKRGDQIALRGYLANYRSSEGGFRGTSTSRSDTGDGACETIYLTDFQILKRANPLWRGMFTLATLLTAGCLVALIAIYLSASYRVRTRPSDPDGADAAGRAEPTFNAKIILQLVALLVLLYLWVRVQ